MSKGGRYKFDPDFAEHIGGYDKGAILQSADGQREYINLVGNNKTDPNDPKNALTWAIYSGDGSVAETSKKWANERTVSFSGAASGSFKLDGSKDASCILTLANSGVVAKMPISLKK